MEKPNLHEIAQALRDAGVPPSLSAAESRLLVQIWRLLADGLPVSPAQVEELVSKLDLAPDAAHSTVKRMSERDDDGNIRGFVGLSLNNHPHRFQVNGHVLSTWCAWDSLFLPPALKRTAHVESPCPRTKKVIRVTITPDKVEHYDPATAVLSMVKPRTTKKGLESAEETWMAFCHYVHYFSSAQVASAWFSGKDVDSAILSIEEGYQLGRLAFKEIIDRN
ncbi:MAG: organomercurial lyase [Acidiferrobacterales bacterium]